MSALEIHRRKWRPVFSFLILTAFVAALWLWWADRGIFWLADLVMTHPDLRAQRLEVSALGQLGDLFGALNAFFAGLAFIGVAFAAWQQLSVLKATTEQLAITKSQLAMSDEQLKLTRDQLNIARQQAHDEAEQNKRRAFEPLFFQLLNRHENLFEAIDLSYPGMSRKTIDNTGADLRRSANAHNTLNDVLDDYAWLYVEHVSKLGPYYRSLYHLFKLVDKAGFEDDAKAEYANIIRATLSNNEVFLLALNCLSPAGKGFKTLVEKYGLLKHMSSDGMPPDRAQQMLMNRFHAGAWLSYPQRKKLKHPHFGKGTQGAQIG